MLSELYCEYWLCVVYLNPLTQLLEQQSLRKKEENSSTSYPPRIALFVEKPQKIMCFQL